MVSRRLEACSTSRPKVAVVFHDAIFSSGATRSMIDIIDAWFCTSTLDVVAIFPRQGTADDYLKGKGVPVRYCRTWNLQRDIKEMPLRRVAMVPVRLCRYAKGRWNARHLLARILMEEKADLVYTNTGTIYAGAWASRRTGIKHIWHLREFSEEDQSCALVLGRRLFYRHANRSDRVVVISEALMRKYVLHIDKSRLIVIWDDVSPRYIQERTPGHPQGAQFTLSIIGGASPGKGQLQAIASVERLAARGVDVRLNVIGNEQTPYGRQAIQYVKDHGLEGRVLFTGVVADVLPLLKQTDVCISCSRSEAFGRVIIESMLSGAVVVAARAGSVPELIRDGENGLTYELDDVKGLADRIELLVREPELFERLRECGHQWALGFTHGESAARLAGLIGEVLGRR